jgi:membrane fusion protein, multidrug efflux system
MTRRAITAMANPPQTVSTIVAEAQAWPNVLEAVGSIRAISGADLSAQVASIVSASHFQSGTEVQKGALDPRLRAIYDLAQHISFRTSQATVRGPRPR